MIHQDFGTRSGETSLAMVPGAWRGSTTSRRLLMGCHGATGSAGLGPQQTPYEHQAITDKTGVPMVFPDLSGAPGGAAAWGNASSLTKVDNAWTAAQTELGVKSDKLLMWGESMGLTTALCYLMANPTKVAAIAGLLPCVNISDIQANNRGGLGASVDTAYAAAWAASAATKDPFLNMTAIRNTGVPMLLYYSTTDTVALPGFAQTFANTVNCRMESLGAIGHAVPSSVDSTAVASFFQNYLT